MKKKTIFLFFIICNTALLTAQKGKWTYLFNGKDLMGWQQLNGKAIYKVENGELIGVTVPNTPNSFLATEKKYSDFIFEVEFLIYFLI